MSVRLIAPDIDGTLLRRSEVPAVNRHAIEAAVEKGIEVALVTGRRFDFAFPIARQIPCALTMIVNNGALVKSKDGTTLQTPATPPNGTGCTRVRFRAAARAPWFSTGRAPTR
jgi:HAD superfamily hydrolase (TIGR01484 family)